MSVASQGLMPRLATFVAALDRGGVMGWVDRHHLSMVGGKGAGRCSTKSPRCCVSRVGVAVMAWAMTVWGWSTLGMEEVGAEEEAQKAEDSVYTSTAVLNPELR